MSGAGYAVHARTVRHNQGIGYAVKIQSQADLAANQVRGSHAAAGGRVIGIGRGIFYIAGPARSGIIF